MVAVSSLSTIQPLYERDGAALFLGDCIAVLESIQAESVDMIFADPPYYLSNGGYSVSGGKRVPVDKGTWDQSNGVENDFEFHQRWLEACKRVLKADGTIWVSGTYHSIYACGYAMQLAGYRVLNDICWFKPNAAPNLGRRMFTASHETLIWASKSAGAKHVFNYDDMRSGDWPSDIFKRDGKQMRSVWGVEISDDVWTGNPPAASEKTFGRHPTQKPLALLERIVLSASEPGHIILDPFAGSGTTGVAALKHGRKFIGIDQSIEYLQEIAARRLEATVVEPTIY